MAKAPKARTPRPRRYRPGDRVQVFAYGLVGKVVEEIYRSNPPFWGYAIELHGTVHEVPGSKVSDPPRPILEEWRRWLEQDLGADYCAIISDAKFARLRAEWAEAHPELAARSPHRGPTRYPGYENPIHMVTVTRTVDRHINRSSNGAFERRIDRPCYWLYCPCPWDTHVAESYQEAMRRKADHEANPNAGR